jgi:hypothetical protein
VLEQIEGCAFLMAGATEPNRHKRKARPNDSLRERSEQIENADWL